MEICMEPSMHNVKILHDSHIHENPPVPRRHHPLYSTISPFHAITCGPSFLIENPNFLWTSRLKDVLAILIEEVLFLFHIIIAFFIVGLG